MIRAGEVWYLKAILCYCALLRILEIYIYIYEYIILLWLILHFSYSSYC